MSVDHELVYQQEDKTCSIIVRSGLRHNLIPYLSFENYSKIVVLTDEQVAQVWLAPLRDALGVGVEVIVIPPGEKEKSLERAQHIWTELSRMGCDRYSLLIAFGGGVIGDLGGYVASAFSRGMHFVQLPTSLMAQVDASIGGKAAVNLGGMKNKIGAFYPPEFVFIDPEYLQTLPQREVVSGFAEVIKHALLFDEERVLRLRSLGLQGVIGDELETVISESMRAKALVVERDPFERTGERQLLNFGHTVGHALESLSHETPYPLTHGEAVSLGMVCEAQISKQLGFLSADDTELVRNLLSTFSLPIQSSLVKDKDRILQLVAQDKKSRAGAVRWAILERIGVGKHSVIVEEDMTREALDILLPDILLSDQEAPE